MTVFTKDKFSFQVYKMTGDEKEIELGKKAFQEYITENPYESFVNTSEETRNYFTPLVDQDEITFECSMGEVVGLKYSVFTKKIPREVEDRAVEEAYQQELKVKKPEDVSYDEIKEAVHKELLYGRRYSESHISMIVDFEHGLFFIEDKNNVKKIVEMFYRLFKLQLQPHNSYLEDESKGFMNWLYVEGAKIGYERAELAQKKAELGKEKDKEEDVRQLDEEISVPAAFELHGHVGLSTEKLRVRVSGDIKTFRTALENVLNGAQVNSLSIAHFTKARSLYYDVDGTDWRFYGVSASYVQKIKQKDLDSGFITSDQIIESRWNLFYETIKHHERVLDIYRKSK